MKTHLHSWPHTIVLSTDAFLKAKACEQAHYGVKESRDSGQVFSKIQELCSVRSECDLRLHRDYVSVAFPRGMGKRGIGDYKM
jgi:hypothetical protein